MFFIFITTVGYVFNIQSEHKLRLSKSKEAS